VLGSPCGTAGSDFVPGLWHWHGLTSRVVARLLTPPSPTMAWHGDSSIHGMIQTKYQPSHVAPAAHVCNLHLAAELAAAFFCQPWIHKHYIGCSISSSKTLLNFGFSQSRHLWQRFSDVSSRSNVQCCMLSISHEIWNKVRRPSVTTMFLRGNMQRDMPCICRGCYCPTKPQTLTQTIKKYMQMMHP
jgi:hypothetical protein